MSIQDMIWFHDRATLIQPPPYGQTLVSLTRSAQDGPNNRYFWFTVAMSADENTDVIPALEHLADYQLSKLLQ